MDEPTNPTPGTDQPMDIPGAPVGQAPTPTEPIMPEPSAPAGEPAAPAPEPTPTDPEQPVQPGGWTPPTGDQDGGTGTPGGVV